MSIVIDILFVWLLTYLLHSSILLGLAWLLEQTGQLSHPRFAENVWRVALCGGLVTASLQMLLHSQLTSTAPHASMFFWQTCVLPAPLNELAPYVVPFWMVLAVGGLLYTGVSVWRLNASSRVYPISTHAHMKHFLGMLASRSGRVAPTIRVSDRWRSPLVLPNGDICVPPWVFERLDEPQREAMLAHELAHVVRKDPVWRIGMHAIAQLGFLQPMHGVALQRLDQAAELCCDDWAAQTSGHRRALAEALYICAENLHTKAVPVLAPAMARNSSPLLVRIYSLLEGGSMFIPKPLRGPSIAVCIAIATLTTTLALPVVAIGVDVVSSRFTLDTRTGKIVSRMDGEIVFSANEDGVLKVSKPLLITQMLNDKTLEIEFKPEKTTTQYSVNGVMRPLDAQGSTWLATVIPALLRETGLDAQGRVTRLLAKGGAERVVAEIEAIQSPYARSSYVQAVFKTKRLSEAHVARVLAAVAAIGPGRDQERQEAYVAAINSRALDPRQLSSLLTDVTTMKTSHAVCEVLLATAAVMPADAELAKQYRSVARTLANGERGRAEKALDHLKV
jgi:beta-lactamase regulating signal transducer with metallopeptidase domain